MNELASRCSLILSVYGRPHSADRAVSEHPALIAAPRDGRARDGWRLMEEHLQAVMGRALIPPPRQRGLREILAGYAGAAPGAGKGRRRPPKRPSDEDRT